ncbi:MAG: tRNA (guanosine(37)-N1)-methyltransferase TrmD [Candidatus Moranbacteria bacterium]|nr:tRNA (guanosine(37)-N1)-methyltransferase TrmD [Candidatus Moranbacteria bacterium]
MQIDLITIFPNIFDSYISESIIKRAREKNIIDVNVHNLRDYTSDAHKTVDDTPYGGGAGMVLKVEPIHKCVEEIIKKSQHERNRIRVIVTSAKGKIFTQERAQEMTKQYDQLIIICGRYEGIDERVALYVADEEMAVGQYVLTGGELPALIMTDAVTRLLPGVLGNEQSAKDESFSKDLDHKEYPQFTKPEQYNGWVVPEQLLSGHHANIAKWRKEKETSENGQRDSEK